MNARKMEQAQQQMADAEALRQRWLAETDPAGNVAMESAFEDAFEKARQAVLDAAAAEEDG